jgi:hypothetical protein
MVQTRQVAERVHYNWRRSLAGSQARHGSPKPHPSLGLYFSVRYATICRYANSRY